MNEPLWTNLRAVKATSQPYTWFIEGVLDGEGDPDDPESLGWVADVNEAVIARDSKEGDTARALAHRYNAHPALLAALKQLLAWADSAGVADVLAGRHAENCGCAEPIEAARAALSLARGES